MLQLVLELCFVQKNLDASRHDREKNEEPNRRYNYMNLYKKEENIWKPEKKPWI